MKRSTLYGLPLAVGVVVALTLALTQPRAHGSNLAVPEGGTFRISLAAGSGIDYIDPALAYTPAAWALLDTVCARLLAYPDKRPPAGFRAVPEVAAAPPRVSRDLRTYTFTLRTGFRFSDGTPVRASAFARAINRTLAPGVASPGAQLTRDIVGAADVLAGRTRTAAGVVAKGNTLVVRFTKPVSDFAARTTSPFFCAVPPTLPSDPEGYGAFPGAGPYYVAEYRPGERVVIKRNRFYGDRGRTTSTASTSTSAPRRRRRCSPVSSRATPTGATPSPGSTSIRRLLSSPPTASIALGSSSSPA